MRLRTFTGRTTMEAIGLVRTHLGPTAIIVSTQEDGNGGARVTAALDDDRHPAAPMPELDARFAKIIDDALTFHGVAPELSDTILAASQPQSDENALAALTGAMQSLYRFEPLTQQPTPALMLVGPPGGGKTVTAAKLAARAVMNGERVRLVTTDLVRAGGVAQLEAFAKILGTPFQPAESPDALAEALESADPAERIIIDSSGVNPFSSGDRAELAALLGACDAEPVLVYAAGGDTADTTAMAQSFAELGCTRIAVTRLDTVRRLGSVIAVAHALSLGLAEAGIAPDIADGLIPFTPKLLARLLLPKGAS